MSRRRRSSSRRRSRRRQDERSLEAMTYGLIFLLFIFAALYPTLRADYIAIAGGAILVGSAIVQSQRGFRVNMFTWLGGLMLLGIGLLAWSGSTLVPTGIFLPILIMIGVVGMSLITGEL